MENRAFYPEKMQPPLGLYALTGPGTDYYAHNAEEQFDGASVTVECMDGYGTIRESCAICSRR